MLSGPSGSGKTLLLRAIADLDPHEGEVRLDGRACEAFAPAQWRRAVGLLPAESQWWLDTVREHFALGVPEADALGSLGFEGDVLDWEVARLSSGERQRLGLLRLLAGQPRVLLLDEPTAHLDARSADAVITHVERYRERLRCPVLWVAHDASLRARTKARGLRLEDGRLEEEPA